jgi:hypothetical protein
VRALALKTQQSQRPKNRVVELRGFEPLTSAVQAPAERASARTARGSICFDFEIGDKRLALFYLRGSGKAALSLYNLAK